MTAPLFDRAHLYVPLVDERGDLHPYAQVRIYLEDGETPYTGAIYRGATGTETWINPHTVAPALIDLYLPGPGKVVLGIKLAADDVELLSHVYELVPHGEDMVRVAEAVYVEGLSTVRAVLSTGATNAFWHPMELDHEHATVAGGVRTTLIPTALTQSGAYAETTVVGVRAGGPNAHSSLEGATALGLEARVGARGAVALGSLCLATESPSAPWSDGAVAIGWAASATGSGVALGARAGATDRQVSAGTNAFGIGTGAISLGAGAHGGQEGLALGKGAGTNSRGNAGSVGLGAGAQYGLPGDTTHTSVLLGAHDGSTLVTTYPNPLGSQSESPWEEFTPTLGFAADTIQFQRHLTWAVDTARLDALGHATVGGRDARVGFYGATPRTRATIADDEPDTGLSALTNLIYALRDLGLLGARREALLDYRAGDLLRLYRSGDAVTSWPEHFGRDTALAVDPTAGPTLREHDDDMNERATAAFWNGFYRRRALPLQQLRGAVLLPLSKHFIAVTEHNDDFGDREGLVNLHSGTDVPADQVLTSSSYRQNRWSSLNISRYERDGLDQTGNFKAHPEHDHVHQVTATTSWPHGTPILGGPRDQTDPEATGDSWSGSVAHVVALDATWTADKARSMATGLGFLYGIRQDEDWIVEPARDYLITQHNPLSGVYIFWDDDYSDSYRGRVWGHVKELPGPIRHRSYIDLQDADRIDYDGPLCGYWYDCPEPLECEVIVLCRQGDWDDEDEADEVFGPFALNNSGTWSMGDRWCRTGRKRCYVRRRDNHAVVCRSWDRRDDCGDDIAVQVFSVNGVTETLEDTVPLWGDKTFSARIRHPGHKVARIYDGVTLIGSTDWQEQGLPRSLTYHPSDPDVDPEVVGDYAYTYEVALAVLAFCEMDSWWDLRRARTILAALESVQAVDGSLREWYLGTEADQGSGTNVDLHAMSWVILAALRYQQVTGDDQFLTFATKLGDYLKGRQITSGAGQGSLRGFAHTAGATNL